VQWLGVERRVPEYLRIGVRVRVDEPRGHHGACRVDLAFTIGRQIRAYFGDAPVPDAHIAQEGRRAGAVNDGPATDQQPRL
jgi:hypothetical protein